MNERQYVNEMCARQSDARHWLSVARYIIEESAECRKNLELRFSALDEIQRLIKESYQWK